MDTVFTLVCGALSAYATIDWFWNAVPQAKNVALLIGQILISGAFGVVGLVVGAIVGFTIMDVISYIIRGPKKEACDGK